MIVPAFYSIRLSFRLFNCIEAQFSKVANVKTKALHMAARQIECVPNFSEGRSKEVIDAISAAISATADVKLLDVDPGASTNRTVYTFVGTPSACVEAALQAARVAWRLIDMSHHHGEHPRMGALDVCPFIPLSPEDMPTCVACANEFGRRLAEELDVPVFLYNEAVTDPKRDYRKTLPQIRAGEYEALAEGKLSKPEWTPDFGPAKYVSRWGATVTGARKFLVAYNINVLGTKEQAHRIALNIREQGRGPKEPGRLKKVQAIGWYLDEVDMAQISTNILDFDEMPMYRVFEECQHDAAAIKVGLAGSEIVGLVPLKSIIDCAEHFIRKDGLFILEESQKIRLVIDRLGLSSMKPFKPEERIIEYMVGANKLGKLASLSVSNYVKSVAARTPVPGGGSVSAVVGSLGVSLATMAGMLTFGNRKFESVDGHMRKLIPQFHDAISKCLPLIDADAQAFADYVEANKGYSSATNAKANAEELAKAEHKLNEAAVRSVRVPLDLALILDELWLPLGELARYVNPVATSDVRVAGHCLAAAIHGAVANVNINLPNLRPNTRDQQLDDLISKAHTADKAADSKLQEVLKSLPDA